MAHHGTESIPSIKATPLSLARPASSPVPPRSWATIGQHLFPRAFCWLRARTSSMPGWTNSPSNNYTSERSNRKRSTNIRANNKRTTKTGFNQISESGCSTAVGRAIVGGETSRQAHVDKAAPPAFGDASRCGIYHAYVRCRKHNFALKSCPAPRSHLCWGSFL